MELELIIMNIINFSGESRSLCMEAISYAKNGHFEKAGRALEEAGEKLSEAYQSQTRLIQEEAEGKGEHVSLLLVHAQDHLMNAITMRDIANEFIELYRSIRKIEGAGSHE